MGPFQKYVVLATIIVLLIWVVVLIWLYRKSKNNTTWPPIIGKCPDYWEVIEGEKGDEDVKCKISHNIGICKSADEDNIMDFNEDVFKGKGGEVYKCSWSKKCKSPWEGIDTIC